MDTNQILNTILQKLDTLDQRLDGLESGQSSINQRLDGLESGQSSINQRLDSLESGQSGINEQLEQIKEDSRHTRVLLESQEGKIQLLCEAQAETAAKFGQLDRMEQTLNEVKSKVEVIEDVIRFHSIDIAALKKAL